MLEMLGVSIDEKAPWGMDDGVDIIGRFAADRNLGNVHLSSLLDPLSVQKGVGCSSSSPEDTAHGQNPHISTSAPSSMTRSGGMRKKSVGRVAMRTRAE